MSLALSLALLAMPAQWPPPPGPANPPAAVPQPAPPQPAPPGAVQPALPAPLFGPAPVLPQIIAPPTPVPGARETEERLDEAKVKDSGRKLEWVWIDARGGFEQLGISTFTDADALTGHLVRTSSSGGVVSVGAGARLLFVTLLLRGQLGLASMGQLVRVGLEAGLHVPLGKIEPHIELGAGYATFAHLNDEVGGEAGSRVHMRGGYGRVGAGLDYFVVPAFSIGGALSAELLGLKRPALGSADVAAIAKVASGGARPSALAQDASGVGGALAATLVLGLHF